MRLRHAAALALTGWYLMLPPLNTEGSVRFDAPLSQWEVLMPFDSATQCEQARDYWRQRAKRDLEKMEAESKKRPAKSMTRKGARSFLIREYKLTFQAPMVTCIATDDPRLKGK